MALLSGAFCALLVPSASAAVFYPQSFTLANGMQVIIVQNRLSPAVAQMVWYKVGAVDDPVGRSGLAHYLEHMMFKGTAHRPAGAFSAQIASMGGEENAYTTHDTTAYHEVVAADHLGDVMLLEADRMRGLVFEAQDALSERDVVISERQERTENSPQGLFQERLNTALFPDHPYGRPVIGWREEIAKMTPDDVIGFYGAHYAPNKAVLVVSGNVETAEVLRLADATFGLLKAAPSLRTKTVPLTVAAPREKRVEMADERVKQPLLAIRYVVPSLQQSATNAYALEVLAEVLSADEVGLLYRHFVMDQQSAAGIHATYDPLSRGPSVFALAATPAPGADVKPLEKAVFRYLQALAQRGISHQDVQKAKQRLQDSAIFARDRLMAPAEILGQATALGVPIAEVERWPERIQAVTPAQVNAALRALIANPRKVVGHLLPAERHP